MKKPIHLLLAQLIAVLFLPGCDEGSSAPLAPSAKKITEKPPTQKPIMPQTNVRPTSPSEVLPALDTPAAKAAFAVVASRRKGETAEAADAEFERLLRQWNPQGKTIQEVKIIIGEPDWEKDGAFGYLFDSGWGGWKWSFLNDGKEVIDVKRDGIN